MSIKTLNFEDRNQAPGVVGLNSNRKPLPDFRANRDVRFPEAADFRKTQVWIIDCVADSADSLDGAYFGIEDHQGTVGIWFDNNDDGTTIPAGASAKARAIEANFGTGASATTVALRISEAITADGQFTAFNNAEVLTILANAPGELGVTDDGDAGFTSREQPGSLNPLITMSAAAAGTVVVDSVTYDKNDPIWIYPANETQRIDGSYLRARKVKDQEPPFMFEFTTDSELFELKEGGNTAGSMLIVVDDQPLKLSAFDSTPVTDTMQYRRIFDWREAGGKKLRNYRIYVEGEYEFRGGTLKETDSFLPNSNRNNRIKAALITDSLSYRGYETDSEPDGSTGSTFAHWLSIITGFDIINLGSSGTGWLNDAGVPRPTVNERQDFLTRYQPDMVIVAIGINDSSFSIGNLETEIDNFITYMATTLPNADLVFVGPWGQASNPAAILVSLNNSMRTKVQAAGGSFISPLGITWESWASAPYPARWITGTGDIITPTGDGNADFYMVSDNVHPTALGVKSIALNIAKGIAGAMSNDPHAEQLSGVWFDNKWEGWAVSTTVPADWDLNGASIVTIGTHDGEINALQLSRPSTGATFFTNSFNVSGMNLVIRMKCKIKVISGNWNFREAGGASPISMSGAENLTSSNTGTWTDFSFIHSLTDGPTFQIYENSGSGGAAYFKDLEIHYVNYN